MIRLKIIKTYLLLTIGSLLETIGIYFFKFPNNFSTGGVSGLSIVLSHFFKGFTPGTFMLTVNIALLIVGFIFVGTEFGFRTVYCSILMSASTRILEIICPLSSPLTSMPLLELIFAIFLAGAGAAILFNYGASTGGTDIVAMILKKYLKTNISKVLFMVDFIIVMLTYFAFGIETWLLCILGITAKILVLNNMLENLNTSKYFIIITAKADIISQYIMNELHKGATVSNSFYGVFSNDKKSVILTAMNRRNAILLRNYVKITDPKAFVIVSTTSDIIGKGFRECM